MAQFGAYDSRSGSVYLLDVQADLLGRLNTRVVVLFFGANPFPLPKTRGLRL